MTVIDHLMMFFLMSDEIDDGLDILDVKSSNEPKLDVLGRIDEIKLDFSESELERIDIKESDVDKK